VINTLNAISIKTSTIVFTETEKFILKFIWKAQKTLNNQNNPEQKESH
jgi:hypothetical protein